MERVVAVRPYLGEVEWIEAIAPGFPEGHDLHSQRPARMLAPPDRLEEVAPVVVAVFPGDPVGVVLGEEFDALVGLEVVLDPEPLAVGVDPHVGVARIAVHVPPRAGDPTVAHQHGDLVGRFRRKGPEVPLHVVIAQVGVGPALLRADEVLELHRVANEEHGCVVPHHVVVALRRVELQRKTTRVAPGVGASPLARHGREPDQGIRRRAGLEDRRLGELAHVRRDLEVTERAPSLGVGLPLGDALPVEIRHLLNQVVVL